MRIVSLSIRNFKSIKSIEINDIESAFIIVGKNSVGKTVILDAIRRSGRRIGSARTRRRSR